MVVLVHSEGFFYVSKYTELQLLRLDALVIVVISKLIVKVKLQFLFLIQHVLEKLNYSQR